MAINIVLESVILIALGKELPAIAKWSGGFLALAAALVGGIATFFDFGKQLEGHRGIANKYVGLAARCETAIARYRDGLIDLQGIDGFLQEGQDRYAEISEEAKAFSTRQRDFKVALESEVQPVVGVRERQLDKP